MTTTYTSTAKLLHWLIAGLVVVQIVLAKVLFVVAGLHIGAALKHAFIDKDGVMQRILPGVG